VVVCTSNKTYSLREVQTSNSHLLCRPVQDLSQEGHRSNDNISYEHVNRFNVIENTPNYYILNPCFPKTDSLESLLEMTMYSGIDDELEKDIENVSNRIEQNRKIQKGKENKFIFVAYFYFILNAMVIMIVLCIDVFNG